jgi:hypothetical protein
MIGMRFGRLVVTERSSRQSRSGRRYWNCVCDCGNVNVVAQDVLRAGKSRSCGCLKRELNRESLRVHGLRKSPLYETWARMLRRCRNERSKEYAMYGGRGIRVCERWIHSVEAFCEDMGPTYREGLTLDRIDNNGPYAPWNCRWVNRIAQANNTRRNRFLVFRGKKMTVAEWARRLNWSADVIRGRIRLGWPVERILTEKPRVLRKVVRT